MTDSALTLVERAAVLTDLKRGAEAVSLLHRAATLAPDDQQLWCELARAQLACNRPTEALQAANRAVGLDPEQEWPHRLASIALRLLGQHDGAVQAAREAVRLAPHTWQVFTQLAEALAGHPHGKSVAGPLYPQATSAAQRAVELAPFEPEAHITMGHVLLAHPDAHWAAQAFREALRLRPDDSRARNGLGVANLRRGDLASAAGDFGTAAGADPRDRVARLNVSAAAWNGARNMTALLVAMILVLSPTVEAPWPALRGGCVLLCLAAVGALVVRSWRRVPPTMRGYLLRLLRREPLLGATLFFAVCSMLLMVISALPASPDDRTAWFGMAFLSIALAVLVRWIGVSRHNRAVDRG